MGQMTDLEKELTQHVLPILADVRAPVKKLRMKQAQRILESVSPEADKLAAVLADFDRNGYPVDPLLAQALEVNITSQWEMRDNDPKLAAKWRAMERLPEGTLGRMVTRFYADRGFVYPGLPGSVPPLLAQHDFVHVLADYGTTVPNELEIFAFIAWAGNDVSAFGLLEVVIGLFETGIIERGVGVFEADTGHLSGPGMAIRFADALRRGAACHHDADMMRQDWHSLADVPVDALRRYFGIVPKSKEAIRAGSAGPWEPGGITPFQIEAAKGRTE